jgi:hypothetical protein
MQNSLDDLIFVKQVADTSKDSYKEIVESNMVSNRQQEYLDMLNSLNEPSTDQEVTKAAGYGDPNYFRPRRKELYDNGFILRGMKRKCRITGRIVYTWYMKVV